MSFEVLANEHGLIRVFALSMGDDEAAPLRADPDAPDPHRAETLSALLGAQVAAADAVEVFPVSDLQDLGLAGYMIEGNGVDPAQIAPDRARLAALDGWVMLVYSRAFGGMPTQLEPAASLTLIGTYTEPQTDWSTDTKLVSKAATERPRPAKKPPSEAAMMGRVATYVLLGLFVFTALFVWIAS